MPFTVLEVAAAAAAPVKEPGSHQRDAQSKPPRLVGGSGTRKPLAHPPRAALGELLRVVGRRRMKALTGPPGAALGELPRVTLQGESRWACPEQVQRQAAESGYGGTVLVGGQTERQSAAVGR